MVNCLAKAVILFLISMEVTRRSFIILLCVVCCFLTLLLSYNNPDVGLITSSLFRREKFSFFVMPSNTTNHNDIKCQMPDWDPFHPSVKSLYKKLRVPYQCGKKPSFLIIKPNATVLIDENKLWKYHKVKRRDITCTYETISRNSGIDKPTDDRISLSRAQRLDFGVPLSVEFVYVKCQKLSRKFHEEYLAMTPLKKDVEERSEEAYINTEISEKLNIVIIGIDSISRLNFIRHFPKTRKFLREELKTIEMRKYNKVADNTFPNLTPLLTGHFVKDYGSGNFFDNIDLIWKHFAEIGYRTMLAEDAPKMATYNFLKKGFKKPPADYYLRPFTLAVEKSKFRKKSKPHCFGDRMEMKVIYDYVRSFVDTMRDRPYFLFAFVARLTHDVLNYAAYADEPTHEILKYLHNTGVTNNSLIVFMSDHGIRFGPIRQTYIGMFEERWPIMHISFPDWFLTKYSDLVRNLKINQDRLTTPFDVHATLIDVFNLVSNGSVPNVTSSADKNGTSLFNEIPKERTCSDASILPHWCTCQRQVRSSVKNKDVRKAADSLIDNINRMLKDDNSGCAALSLNAIMDAYISKPENSSSGSGVLDYLLKVSVDPSSAIFEGTVRFSDSKYHVQGDISRINHYGDQGDCIKDSSLRKYCYCY